MNTGIAGTWWLIYVENMATREVRNKLDKQRQYRNGKSRDRYERNETELGSSVSKRRRMNSEFVEKWDAAALKVISRIVLVRRFLGGLWRTPKNEYLNEADLVLQVHA